MEEQILPYYLKVFSILSIIFLISICLVSYIVLNFNITLKENFIIISKGDNISNVINDNILDNNIYKKKLYLLFSKVNLKIKNKSIHYGDFYIKKNISLNKFLNIISKPSNVINKITIVEGWSKSQLNLELSKYFTDSHEIAYEDIIADTYYFEKNENFEQFLNKLKIYKKNYFKKHENKYMYKKFGSRKLIIIASLLEKEGLDINDKRKIFSVIYNRLAANMKLQIDATVLYAITKGKYNLDRKLYLRDLKFKSPYNTYIYKGLPPKPISYAGTKTLNIIFENYKSDFLFYFYNNSLKKHIFSKNYNDHIKKLNEYRNEK